MKYRCSAANKHRYLNPVGRSTVERSTIGTNVVVSKEDVEDMRRMFLRLSVLILAGMLLFAGGVSAKTIVFSAGADAVRLDPPDMTDNVSETVLRHIMDGLVEFDEKLNIKPALATKWEVLDEGKTYKFYLREGVKFHDGTPFNAKAVVANFERILNGDLRRTSLYKPYIASVEAAGEYVVLFHLKNAFGAFLNHLAHGAGLIQSPAAIQKWGDQIGRHPVGTGPFVFKEWVPGDHITVVANKSYWGGKPKVDEIVFRVVPEDATRVFQLEAGEADVATGIPPTDVARLQKSPALDVLVKDSLRVIYIGMNTRKAPLNNVKVRQAINYAINKDLIVKEVLGGLGRVSDSPLAPLTTGYYSTGGYPYNPAKAKQLLAEAGYPNGFSIKLWTPRGRYLKDYETALAVQQMLADVGIKAKLETMEWSAYLSALYDVTPETAQAELFLLGWAPSTGDADWVLRPLMSSDLMPPDGDNSTFYSNPKVDELIKKGMTEHNPDKRAAYYKEAQIQITKDAPWAYLHVMKQIVGKKTSLKGVKILPIEIVLVKDAYFD